MLENTVFLASSPMVVALLLVAFIFAIMAPAVSAKRGDRDEFPGRRQGGGTHATDNPIEQVDDAPTDSE